MSRSLMGFAAGVALAAVLGFACGGGVPHPPYIPQPSGALAVITLAPPPARVEHIPPRPKVRGAVWVDGEWTLRRSRWAWTLGKWVVAPDGASYAPWAFQRAPDGTMYFAPSSWRDADGKILEAPTALATATADAVGVVDPEGNPEVTGRTLRTAPSASAALDASPPAAASLSPVNVPVPVPEAGSRTD